MNNSGGFFITKLAVTGVGKPDAVLTFTDGLNVVSGASDTGKSFALSCIDFAFGARDAPRPISEVAGYGTVSLHLTSRANQEQLVLERGLAGGDVRIVRHDQTGKRLEELIIPFKHKADNPKTLSGVLLKLSNLWGLQVRKNARGERRSLSFRDVAYLCVVDEERIIAERPPQLSDSYFERTVESEVFRLLATGNESGKVIVVPGKEEIASIGGKIEAVENMIENGLSELQKMGLKEDALDKELAEIELMRTNTLSEYDRARASVTELEANLKNNAQALREAQARNAVIEGLTKRFRLLDAYYESNINRLATIEETGSLLQSLPSKPCPVCGALPEAHRLEHAGEQYQLSAVHVAARAEAEKIKILKNDLHRVLGDLEREHGLLQAETIRSAGSVDKVQSLIGKELMPKVKESAQALREQNERRDLLLRGKVVSEQLDQLRNYVAELTMDRAAGKTPRPKVSTTATTVEMDMFARAVEAVLNAWNYPNTGRVVFSEDNQDLIIGGASRASHGKGVRALTCAAFIIGLMQHCHNKRLRHPFMVALDSPLVAYQEPDNADGEIQKLRQAGVKDAFYSSLASGLAKGQVIVFENEDPSVDLKGTFTKHHFTKTKIGRYGFIPHQ